MAIQLRAVRAGTAALRSTSIWQHIPTRPVSTSSLIRSASSYSQLSRNNSFGFNSSERREQNDRKPFDRAPRARFGMQDRGNDRGDRNDGAPRPQERYGSEKPTYRSSSTQGEATSFGTNRPSTYAARSYNGAQRDKGDGDDRFQRRQSGDSSGRPSYRSSSSHEDGKKFDRTDRVYGEKKTFDRTDRPAYGGRKVFDKSDRSSSYGERAYQGEAKAFDSDKKSYNGSNARQSDQTSKVYTRNDRPYGQFRRNNEEGETDLSTSKKPIELERRLRIRPGTSPYDASVHLNNYIRNSRNPKSHGSNDAAGAEYLETAEEILKTAPKESVNVAVWNVLLSGFAKERKYQRMFKAFNDMKKRGIRPSSRTYAIMLDNYPSSFDSPAKTLSRATLLYDQAQEHVQEVLDKIAEAKESEGYELSSDRPSKRIESDEDAESTEEKAHLSIDAYTSGNAVAPTNAYLAQMSHFSRFDEVKRVFEAMPKDGPRAPDGKTYTILFEAIMAFAAKQRSSEVTPEVDTEDSGKPSAVPSKDTQETLFDPIALWKEIVERDTLIRQKIGKGSGQAKAASRAGPRLMDEQQAPLLDDRLVITALRCFMSGPMEQRTFALDQIVPSVYNLSAPGRSTYSTALTPSNSRRFEISERAVETILKLCLAAGRAREGVHYAEQILNMPKAFTDQLSLTHYNAILALYSKENDIDKCLEVLDMKPPFLRGQAWPRSSWVYALKAARFAGNWDKFMVAFKRMTRMPAVLEAGKQDSPPIGNSEVDDQIASLLLATATESKKVSAMRDAMRVFAYYYTGRVATAPSTDVTSTYSRYWRRQLLASLQACLSAIENAGQDASSGRNSDEERAWRVLVDQVGSTEKDKGLAPRGRTVERTRTYGERNVASRQPQREYLRR